MITLPSRYQNPTQRQADLTQDMTDLASVVTQINAGLSPDIISFLDVYDSTASQLIPSTPTVIVFPTVNSNVNMGYDTGTGIVTIITPGIYSIILAVNCFNSVLTTVFYGAEINTGSGFSAVTLSGRQQNINVNIQGQLIFSVNANFVAGQQIKFYMWASNGTATFNTTTLTSLPDGALMVPAKRITIAGSSS